MKSVIKIVLLTSNHLRHKYIAHKLFEEFNLKCIITEEKSHLIQGHLNEGINPLIKNHFEGREKSENYFFGSFSTFPETELIELPHGSINSEKVLEILKLYAPDYIILFGTSIIKETILNAFPNRIINLHLGLSPYYKGSATNLWPLYYNEPECVGATIHLAAEKVDAGDILFQIRPEYDSIDTIHSLGNKVIKISGKILPEIILKYNKSLILPVHQAETGMVFKNKDFNPEILSMIYRNFKNGMMNLFINSKDLRLSKKPIIEN
ncbi:MAG: hypothetical protein IT243_02650 [Bacteroidia bacterium]|nr:hypothetical protein [Bacteroidia bacterium]